MKFVEKFSGGVRLGCLSEISNASCETIKTPFCLTYTSSGSVPHLTYDTFQHLGKRKGNFLLQTLPTIVSFQGPIEQMKTDLGNFIGLPEYPLHISVQNPAVATPSGYNVKKGVSVWTQGGKKLLTPVEFMKIQSLFQPLSYQALCDSDTPKDCPKKRLLKSVNNTLSFLDDCLKLHADLPRLSNTSVFGTITGGFDINLRRKSAEETAKRKVDGFVIDGFNSDGNVLHVSQFFEIRPILSEVLKLLPTDKPRMMNGPLSPIAIIEAVECGIDIFDSSYACVLAEAGEALTLPLHNLLDLNSSDDKLVKGSKQSFKVDLTDNFYADKFNPISKLCTCYACLNFTCAYIHHLVSASELLGRVLLMLHNLHELSDFFSCIRKSIEDQTFDLMKKRLNFQLKDSQ